MEEGGRTAVAVSGLVASMLGLAVEDVVDDEDATVEGAGEEDEDEQEEDQDVAGIERDGAGAPPADPSSPPPKDGGQAASARERRMQTLTKRRKEKASALSFQAAAAASALATSAGGGSVAAPKVGGEGGCGATPPGSAPPRRSASPGALQFARSVKTLLRQDDLEDIEDDLLQYQVKDVSACRHVFQLYDINDNGTLDQAELRGALAKLGLRARSQQDRIAIRDILRSVTSLEVTFEDFIEALVPRVRRALAELHKVRVEEWFRDADTDESGLLSLEEVVKALQVMGTFPGQELVEQAVFEIVPDAVQGLLSLEGGVLMNRDALTCEEFEKLVFNLQESTERQRVERFESIVQSADIGLEDEQLWANDLLEVWDLFHKLCDEHGMVNEAQIMSIAHELDNMPSGMKLLTLLKRVVAEERRLTGADAFVFSQCLDMLGILRRREAETVQAVFEDKVKGSGALDMQACYFALKELKVEADAQEIRLLLDEFDEDGTGEVDAEEFGALTSFVRERLRKSRREAERRIAVEIGLTQDQHDAARAAFVSVDKEFVDALTHQQALHGIKQMYREPWALEEATAILPEYGQSRLLFTDFLKLVRRLENVSARYVVCRQFGFDEEDSGRLCKTWRALRPNPNGAVLQERVASMLSEGRAMYGLSLPGGSSSESMHILLALFPSKYDLVDFSSFLSVMGKSMAKSGGRP